MLLLQRQLVAADQQRQPLAHGDAQFGVRLVRHRADDAGTVRRHGGRAVVGADAERGEQAPEVEHVRVEAALLERVRGALFGAVTRLRDGEDSTP